MRVTVRLFRVSHRPLCGCAQLAAAGVPLTLDEVKARMAAIHEQVSEADEEAQLAQIPEAWCAQESERDSEFCTKYWMQKDDKEL